MQVLLESINGFPPFALHLAVSLLLLAVFVAVYTRFTPYPELELIRQGNVAAAISLSGATLGYAIPLAYASAQSGNLADMVLWGGIALITQLAVYAVVRMLLIPGLVKDIEQGGVAQGAFLGSLSVATGILNAGCMTY